MWTYLYSQKQKKNDRLFWLNSKCNLQVLIDYIANADWWDDFHEVGRQTSVESSDSFSLNDVFEEICHAPLRSSFHCSCSSQKQNKHTLLVEL